MPTDETRRPAMSGDPDAQLPAAPDHVPPAPGEAAPRVPLGATGRPLRHFSTYTSVGDWYADYRGKVPIQMAAGLSGVMAARSLSFADAYRLLVERGAIIEIVSMPEPDTEDGSSR